MYAPKNLTGVVVTARMGEERHGTREAFHSELLMVLKINGESVRIGHRL